jgi:DNA-binding transcriptional ArsR family regulator
VPGVEIARMGARPGGIAWRVIGADPHGCRLDGSRAAPRRWRAPDRGATGEHALTYNRMVIETDNDPSVDRVFHALSDPTRRDIVQRAIAAEYSVSALARAYPMSFTAVHKHVAVLEAAELVVTTRRGRERLVRTRIDGLREARRALDALQALWRERIDRMDEILSDG